MNAANEKRFMILSFYYRFYTSFYWFHSFKLCKQCSYIYGERNHHLLYPRRDNPLKLGEGVIRLNHSWLGGRCFFISQRPMIKGIPVIHLSLYTVIHVVIHLYVCNRSHEVIHIQSLDKRLFICIYTRWHGFSYSFPYIVKTTVLGFNMTKSPPDHHCNSPHNAMNITHALG